MTTVDDENEGDDYVQCACSTKWKRKKRKIETSPPKESETEKERVRQAGPVSASLQKSIYAKYPVELYLPQNARWSTSQPTEDMLKKTRHEGNFASTEGYPKISSRRNTRFLSNRSAQQSSGRCDYTSRVGEAARVEPVRAVPCSKFFSRKVHKILPSCAHSRRAIGLPIPPPRATKIPARGFTVAWPEGILGGSALRSVNGERT